MPTASSQVDAYLKTSSRWQAELAELRRIALACDLVEAFKWRQPCYTYQGANVAILGSFKESCALSFFKGSLLKDPKKVLQRPGENTQAARVIRFTDVQAILKLEPTLKKYLKEAIAVEQAGFKVERDPAEVVLPEELEQCFDNMAGLKKAFDSLTPGRQRAYVMHFAAPKQSTTRTARVEKCAARILDGKGLNDCVCGLSKKMPGCDGSHKFA